jgi:hypothetical protein
MEDKLEREILRQVDQAFGFVPLIPKPTPEVKPKEPFPLRAITQKGNPPVLEC